MVFFIVISLLIIAAHKGYLHTLSLRAIDSSSWEQRIGHHIFEDEQAAHWNVSGRNSTLKTIIRNIQIKGNISNEMPKRFNTRMEGKSLKKLQSPLPMTNRYPKRIVYSTESRQNPYKTARMKENSASPYYYPPRILFPLPSCFINSAGYTCCNSELNDLMVITYEKALAKSKTNPCNVNYIAGEIQKSAQVRFNSTFELIVGYSDFAEMIHFSGDLVCKLELQGKYILAYATAPNSLKKLESYKGKFLNQFRRLYGFQRSLPI